MVFSPSIFLYTCGMNCTDFFHTIGCHSFILSKEYFALKVPSQCHQMAVCDVWLKSDKE